MSLKTLYTEIKTALQSYTDSNGDLLFKHVGVWNNQVNSLLSKENDIIQIQYPAAFVEIIIEDIEEMQMHSQLWNVLINIHIIDDYYNNELTENEENLRIFDLTDLVWDNFHHSKFTNTNRIVCVSNIQDNNHSNVYHYIQGYEANYQKSVTETGIIISGATLMLSGQTSITI